MAGSRKWMNYVADNGTNYSISADESNVELIMGAQVPVNGNFPRVPSGFKPRYVTVQDVSGNIKRQIPVLTLARFIAISGATALTLPNVGDIDGGTDVRIRLKKSEFQRNLPFTFDTGKLDGDAD